LHPLSHDRHCKCTSGLQPPCHWLEYYPSICHTIAGFAFIPGWVRFGCNVTQGTQLLLGLWWDLAASGFRSHCQYLQFLGNYAVVFVAGPSSVDEVNQCRFTIEEMKRSRVDLNIHRHAQPTIYYSNLTNMSGSVGCLRVHWKWSHDGNLWWKSTKTTA